MHQPGDLNASDFSDMSGLDLTIAVQHHAHMVYHFVLTYSNWGAMTVCSSESYESLSEGLPRRPKQQRERAARKFAPDFTKYDFAVIGQLHERLPKRTAIFTIVRFLFESGHTLDPIAAAMPWRKNSMFRVAKGELSAQEFLARQVAEVASGGREFSENRFYCDDGELFHRNGHTYSFTNQWGHRCIESIDALLAAFPEEPISYRASEY